MIPNCSENSLYGIDFIFNLFDCQEECNEKNWMDRTKSEEFNEKSRTKRMYWQEWDDYAIMRRIKEGCNEKKLMRRTE